MATDRRDRTPTADPPATDDEHAAHLERSRRVWDRWSDWYGTSESDFEPIREAAIDRLDLQRGDRVLEIGCGPGVNFERVRRDIGAEGELVAVDYSPGMISGSSVAPSSSTNIPFWPVRMGTRAVTPAISPIPSV